MMRRDLREFINLLEAERELHTVAVPVDPFLEIAAVTDRVCKSQNNRALLFETVKGSRFRVATNLFGSERRMSLALGMERLTDLTGWLDRLLDSLPGKHSADKLQALTVDTRWGAALPEHCADASQLQAVAINLGSLPILKSHPLDGQPDHAGRFMTLPLIITADPEFSNINCGMYRAAAVDSDTLVLKWSSSSGAAAHEAAWQNEKKPMPVVIALGGPPQLTFAATLPLPAALDEFTFAGLLRGEPLKVYTCANGLSAPVDAEIVIEGYLDTGQAIGSGSFGNHTGFYTPSAAGIAVKVTSIRQRRDMILPATVVGRPPMEDCWLARAGGCLLLSLLKIDVAEVINLHYPLAGIFHGGVIIALRDACGRGVELIAAIRSSPWFSNSRVMVIVDAEQDPADEAGVCWRIMNSVDWEQDLLIEGDQLSIDATMKPDGTKIPVATAAEMTVLVKRRWKEYGFDD